MFILVTAALASPSVEAYQPDCVYLVPANPVVHTDNVAPKRVLLVGSEVSERWTHHTARATEAPVMVASKLSPTPRRMEDALRLVPGARMVGGQWRLQGGVPTVVVDGGMLMDRGLVPVR